MYVCANWCNECAHLRKPKPNHGELENIAGGLNGIESGLEGITNNQVSSVKLIVHPCETA